MTLSGNGTFGRSFGLETEISALIRRDRERLLLFPSPPCDNTAKKVTCCLQTRKRAIIRHCICWHLHLELAASRTVRNVLFKPPSLFLLQQPKLRQSTCNILNSEVKKNVLLNEKENNVCPM